MSNNSGYPHWPCRGTDDGRSTTSTASETRTPNTGYSQFGPSSYVNYSLAGAMGPISGTNSQSQPSQMTTPLHNSMSPHSNSTYQFNSPNPLSSTTPMPLLPQETEIRQLRAQYDRAVSEIHRLQAERASMVGANQGGLPARSQALSPSFQASWKARTDLRIRKFCSLNRAGNALCAWHDSRRERRAYPPRNAPRGYLNCGCTYEEALFEDSLARHGVGAYHPGDNVRMDPALRNPLLRLLQQRYGYMDGDFERDPNTGDWLEGEGPARWEQQPQTPQSSSRRP